MAAQRLMIEIRSPKEIGLIRRASQIVALTLKRLEEHVRPGITTIELDRIAEKTIKELGGIPAFKGLYGYPNSICTSVNEQVVHGIPGNYTLREGDIISIDVGAQFDGYYGDAAVTLPIGEVSEEKARLMEVAKHSLDVGIQKVREGNRLSDVSHAIQTVVEEAGFSVVRQFVGHGIGTRFHEEPQIPNFGEAGQGPRLKRGMVLAIEPMVNCGTFEVEVLEDNWTAVTKDRRPSAHFEHTVVVTAGRGPEVLTTFDL